MFRFKRLKSVGGSDIFEKDLCETGPALCPSKWMMKHGQVVCVAYQGNIIHSTGHCESDDKLKDMSFSKISEPLDPIGTDF